MEMLGITDFERNLHTTCCVTFYLFYIEIHVCTFGYPLFTI